MMIGHTDKVLSVAFSHDSLFIASGSQDKTIRIWNIETGLQLMSLLGHTHYVN